MENPTALKLSTIADTANTEPKRLPPSGRSASIAIRRPASLRMVADGEFARNVAAVLLDARKIATPPSSKNAPQR